MIKKMILVLALMCSAVFADPNELCRTKIVYGGYCLNDSKGNRLQIKCIAYPAGTTLNVQSDPNEYLLEYNPINAAPNETVNFVFDITVTDPQTNNSCLTETNWQEIWTFKIIEPVEPERPRRIPFVAK